MYELRKLKRIKQKNYHFLQMMTVDVETPKKKINCKTLANDNSVT